MARWTPGPYIYSSWQPSEAMLDSFARKHLSYELQALTGQSARLIRIYPNLLDPAEDALLEATLAHLRLLNEFLGSRDQAQQACPKWPEGLNPDAFARHWLPTWRPRAFLTVARADRISKQVAHLSGKRRLFHHWPIDRMATDCCEIFVRFLTALEDAAPLRARPSTMRERTPSDTSLP